MKKKIKIKNKKIKTYLPSACLLLYVEKLTVAASWPELHVQAGLVLCMPRIILIIVNVQYWLILKNVLSESIMKRNSNIQKINYKTKNCDITIILITKRSESTMVESLN